MFIDLARRGLLIAYYVIINTIKIWKTGLYLMSPKTFGDKKQYESMVPFGWFLEIVASIYYTCPSPIQSVEYRIKSIIRKYNEHYNESLGDNDVHHFVTTIPVDKYENMRDINKKIKIEFVKYIENLKPIQHRRSILSSIFKIDTITDLRNGK